MAPALKIPGPANAGSMPVHCAFIDTYLVRWSYATCSFRFAFMMRVGKNEAIYSIRPRAHMALGVDILSYNSEMLLIITLIDASHTKVKIN